MASQENMSFVGDLSNISSTQIIGVKKKKVILHGIIIKKLMNLVVIVKG